MAALLAAAAPAWVLGAQLVITPRATLLPGSPTNRPFLAADHTAQPVDLAAADYVESELLVSGQASRYDWAPAGAAAAVTARGATAPYTTRILLRRPQNVARFSGRVIVELLPAGDQHDSAPLWGMSWDYFTRHGDAWVGLTVQPAAAAALQKFDPVRYAGLSLASPQPAGCQAEPGSGADASLAWDVIAQAGALLRSSSKENPLLAYSPARIILAGFGQAGSEVMTWANALHGGVRLGDGAPIYDGFLDAAGTAVAALGACAAPLPAGDARRGFVSHDVPFVAVMTQSDLAAALPLRRDDGDARGDVFRWYEIAGAAQSGPYAAGLPAAADLAIAGLAPPEEDSCRETRSDFPLQLAFNAVWQQYEDLLVGAMPMNHEPRIDTDPLGVAMTDTQGNALGGWRLPQIEVPLAVYRGRGTPRAADVPSRVVCAVTGTMQPFDAARLKSLYRNRGEFLRRFNAAVDQALAARRLVKEDAAALKAPAARSLSAF